MTSPNSERILPLPRQSDARGYYLHCLGGFRAANSAKNVWLIEPLLIDGRACRKGYFSDAELDTLIRSTELTAIAFHDFGWTNGSYHSKWSPLIPGRTNHMRGPSALWSSLAANSARQRVRSGLEAAIQPTHDSIAKVIDARTAEEALARSISLSLRSIDISVEQISEFYHEQLVNLSSIGGADGRRFSNTQDQILYAHVHSFFLHLGAARDYLGALIATRLGLPSKIDSMARLVGVLRPQHMGKEPLLDLLDNCKLLQPTSKNSSKWEWSGWLKEASDLRNQFVHTRPYGAQHAEGFGRLMPKDPEIGLYRYVRPVHIDGLGESDIFDVIVHHYRAATKFFQDLAEESGRNLAMTVITDEDIISIEERQR